MHEMLDAFAPMGYGVAAVVAVMLLLLKAIDVYSKRREPKSAINLANGELVVAQKFTEYIDARSRTQAEKCVAEAAIVTARIEGERLVAPAPLIKFVDERAEHKASHVMTILRLKVDALDAQVQNLTERGALVQVVDGVLTLPQPLIEYIDGRAEHKFANKTTVYLLRLDAIDKQVQELKKEYQEHLNWAARTAGGIDKKLDVLVEKDRP